MESQSYPYTAHSNIRNGTIAYTYRPLVDVEVGGGVKKRRFKALVDSGTEITVMDLNIARLLEIGSENRQLGELSGLESWKTGFLAPVSLRVDKFEQVFNFTVLFIEDLGKNFDIILGQDDFFKNFDVTFKKSEHRFYLQQSFPERSG